MSLNVKEKMRELLDLLHNEGVNDVAFPDAKFDGEGDENYAIICDCFPDDFDAGHYFDYDACREDFVAMVRSHFAADPTLTVDIDGFNYVEVSRK